MKPISIAVFVLTAGFGISVVAQTDTAVQSATPQQSANASTEVIVKGEDLQKIIFGQDNGSTWRLADNRKFSFFRDGTFIDCAGKVNSENCAVGVFEFKGDHVLRTYKKDLLKGSPPPQSRLYVRKNEDRFNINTVPVVKYSSPSTLTLATEEQIRSLSGKKFKYMNGDVGETKIEFKKDLSVFICAQVGCETSSQIRITNNEVTYDFFGRYARTASTLIFKDSENFLWGGKPMVALD